MDIVRSTALRLRKCKHCGRGIPPETVCAHVFANRESGSICVHCMVKLTQELVNEYGADRLKDELVEEEI